MSSLTSDLVGGTNISQLPFARGMDATQGPWMGKPNPVAESALVHLPSGLSFPQLSGKYLLSLFTPSGLKTQLRAP